MAAIKSLKKRPALKDLETGDLLFLPTGSWVGPTWNPVWWSGHVAMVFFKEKGKEGVVSKGSNTVPYVVEAVKNAKNDKKESISKVREIPYDDWAKKYTKFGHGRISRLNGNQRVDLSDKERKDLVTEALRHLDKSYNSLCWPSLDDDGPDARFSCTKLILVAAYNALGIALDRKNSKNPERWVPSIAFWLRKSRYIFDVPPSPPPPPPPPSP